LTQINSNLPTAHILKFTAGEWEFNMCACAQGPVSASSIQRKFAVFLLMLALIWATRATAVPAYARQTGQACVGCHVGSFGPQLNAFGRQFKLLGYTLKAGDDFKPPLSAMLVASYTHTAKDQSADAGPHDGKNNNSSLQQLSIFAAGRFSEHIGTFSQITYSDINQLVALDNVDFRYAKPFSRGEHSGVFGISLNNNPGLSDLYHAQAAWRFPFISSELAPAPNAAVLSDGGLAQQVIGADAYLSWDANLYASVGLYKTLSPAFLARINADYGGSIRGAAPYWRLSWQPAFGDGEWAIGVAGLHARIAPESAENLTNDYDDVSVDAEFEKNIAENDVLTFTGNFTHERQRLRNAFANDEADRINHTLNEMNLNASYYLAGTYGLTLGMFNISGTGDEQLFVEENDSGSLLHAPNSRGEILQADWTPFGKADSYAQHWANLRCGLQFTHYEKFNGGKRNYDGFGRNAGHNNTLFLFVWTAI
jgi:hypothetical protein